VFAWARLTDEAGLIHTPSMEGWDPVRKLGVRQQRTLRSPVSLQGAGLLSGRMVRLRFRPAPPNTGPVFIRTDLATPSYIPARASLVTDTHRRTTLGHLPNGVTLVEHVLSALAGMRIDNCYIELDGPEPPGLDGSSWRFVEVLRDAGAITQRATRGVWTVEESISVECGPVSISFHPAEHDELRISYQLDYGPDSPIDNQKHTQVITPESYARDLAPCRTFLLESEAVELHRAGVGLHLTPADVLVFGPSGRPIDNVLRFDNEPARHKVLDILGDVALFGRDLRGHIVAQRSGHPLNALLVQELVKLLPERRQHSDGDARVHAVKMIPLSVASNASLN
jgi:UDP-3-O-[3-hydroxymyristoyl] N-acetylglucosamine deacetylase